MELKDVILSTLAEIENASPVNNNEEPLNNIRLIKKEEVVESVEKPFTEEVYEEVHVEEKSSDSEMLFLTSMRERLLVLFEGFQAPNNTNIEAKVDMTLNFLEYVLVSIDDRVQKLEIKARK